MYASGKTVAEITKYLNAKRVKTSQGRAFNKNSLHRLLRNKRYIGYYIYKDTETPGGMPRIIEDELFERVQHILDRNKKAPARSRGREEYLLTTKLFCGYCRGMVNIFLRTIYLYDDRMTLILNGGDRPITVDDILLDEIEEHFESVVSGHAGCSPLVAVAPPT